MTQIASKVNTVDDTMDAQSEEEREWRSQRQSGRFRSRPFVQTWLHDQLEFNESQHNTDLTIRCKDGEFKIHRFLLFAVSDEARILLKDAPKKDALILLPEHSIVIVQKVFSLMYMGFVHSESMLEEFQIKELAKSLGIKNLELSQITGEEKKSGKLLKLVDLDHPSTEKGGRQEIPRSMDAYSSLSFLEHGPDKPRMSISSHRPNGSNSSSTNVRVPEPVSTTPVFTIRPRLNLRT